MKRVLQTKKLLLLLCLPKLEIGCQESSSSSTSPIIGTSLSQVLLAFSAVAAAAAASRNYLVPLGLFPALECSGWNLH